MYAHAQDTQNSKCTLTALPPAHTPQEEDKEEELNSGAAALRDMLDADLAEGTVEFSIGRFGQDK